MRDLNDRLRDHLDAAAPPIDIDLLVRALVAEGRMDVMPVTTLEPERDTPAPLRRRWRFSLVFAAALIVTIVAIGAVLWLGGGSESEVPADRPEIDEPAEPEGEFDTEEGLGLTPDDPAESDQFEGPSDDPAQLPPPAQATLVTLDPEVDLAWAQQAITVGIDGEIRVLYQRDEATVAMAVCIDTACAAPELRALHDSGGRLGWVIGEPRADGPVFWLGAGDGDAASSFFVCADDGCESPVIVPLLLAVGAPGTPVVAMTPDGIPLVSLMSGVYPSDVITFRCMDPSCEVNHSNWITWSSRPDQYVGKTAIAQGDGPPVIGIATEESLLLGYCRHDNCRPESDTVDGFAAVAEVAMDAAIFRGPELMLRPDGTPVAVLFLENGLAEDIVVLSCDAPECLDPAVTTLGTTVDSFTEWDAVLGSDGLLRVAWTDRGTLWLATCSDETCTAFDLVEVSHPARDVAIEIGPEGFPILATSSPDRGLELLICADAQCTYAPPETP